MKGAVKIKLYISYISRLFSTHIYRSRVKWHCGGNFGDKLQQIRVQCSWSVSSLMSVFLPKRVKVGSQIDAYWGILSLCLYSYFLIQPHDWGRCNTIIYSAGFLASHRVTDWIFNVLFLIIRMRVICLQSRQGLRVCALYLTKIDVNKINLIQNKTEM